MREKMKARDMRKVENEIKIYYTQHTQQHKKY